MRKVSGKTMPITTFRSWVWDACQLLGPPVLFFWVESPPLNIYDVHLANQFFISFPNFEQVSALFCFSPPFILFFFPRYNILLLLLFYFSVTYLYTELLDFPRLFTCLWHLCAVAEGFNQIIQLFSCVSPSLYHNLSSLSPGFNILSRWLYLFLLSRLLFLASNRHSS